MRSLKFVESTPATPSNETKFQHVALCVDCKITVARSAEQMREQAQNALNVQNNDYN
jgi:hypothetical protein